MKRNLVGVSPATPPTSIRPRFRLTHTRLYSSRISDPALSLTPKHFAYVQDRRRLQPSCSFCLFPRGFAVRTAAATTAHMSKGQGRSRRGVEGINLKLTDSTYNASTCANHRRAISIAGEVHAATLTRRTMGHPHCTPLSDRTECAQGEFLDPSA